VNSKLHRLRHVDPLHVVAHIFTAGALLAVVARLSPVFGHLVGVDGGWTYLPGGFLAVLFDAAWYGLTLKSDTAVKARQWTAAAGPTVAAVLFAVASTVLMVRLGHGGVLAALPPVALLLRLLAIVFDTTVTDRGVAKRIAADFDRDRDDQAEHNAGRKLTVSARRRRAETDVDQAAADAAERLEWARHAVEVRTAQDGEYAALYERVTASQKTNGERAEAFGRWLADNPLNVGVLLPTVGPAEPVRPLSIADDSLLALATAAGVDTTDPDSVYEPVRLAPVASFGFTATVREDSPQVATNGRTGVRNAGREALKARTEAQRANRAAAMSAMLSGSSDEDVAAAYGVSVRTVRRWRAEQ
jgi:hypothetical protein